MTIQTGTGVPVVIVPGDPLDSGSTDGADVSMLDAATQSWWQRTAAQGGPGWTINGAGSEASPWIWDSTNQIGRAHV